ncbi:hypothetical protein GJ744_000635 [Endocarpon pusillum]|uniref:Uncharacterized protein n=1 Tax=Endocarpon pusillum TaxID=364733 RepID=A0A8H7E1R0_9EURO|nr:hypothetical protein GJ744_000635 [Endocarpon pusillum]
MSSNQRDVILASVKHQTFRIPNPHAVFPGWPQDTSRHLPSIVRAMDSILDK